MVNKFIIYLLNLPLYVCLIQMWAPKPNLLSFLLLNIYIGGIERIFKNVIHNKVILLFLNTLFMPITFIILNQVMWL